MAEILRVGFGIALTCAAIATAIFVARGLLSEQLKLWGGGHAGDDTWLAKLHIGAVLLGWCAIVLFGVKGLLFWLPWSWDEGLFSLSGLAAIGSIPVLMHIERLPRIRRRLEVGSAVSTWLQEQLFHGNTPSVGTLEQLSNDVTDLTKTPVEQEIAAEKLAFAKALRERDERFEAQTVQRLKRDQAEQAEQAERRRQEDEKLAANQRRAADLDRALKALVQPLPATSDPMSMNVGAEAVIDHELLLGNWTLFKQLIVSIRPRSETGVIAAQKQLEAILVRLPGAELPSGVAVEILFSGHERDGFCDAVGIVEGNRKPLGEVLVYEDSLQGLLLAFFFGAALQRQWSWGHGFYDRDHGLIVTEDELKNALEEARLPKQGEATWPPTGIRVRRLPDAYVLSCLSTRPGRGIFELSVKVSQGNASPLLVRDIYVWGAGVYY